MATAVLLIVFLSLVVVYGTDIVLVNLVNSTKIGSSQGVSACPCKLDFTITLTDNSNCQCQPSTSRCTQCNFPVNTTTDLKIDTGNRPCVLNNIFPGKNELYLAIKVTEKENKVLLFPTTKNIESFCQHIGLDRTLRSYNISARHSSILVEVSSTSTTTTPKTVTNVKNSSPGNLPAGIKPTPISKNGATEAKNEDDSLSAGAIAGIVIGAIGLVILLIVVGLYCLSLSKKDQSRSRRHSKDNEPITCKAPMSTEIN